MNENILAKGLNADLENFELTDIMQLITQQVKCGILSVEGEDGSSSWSFNDGKLVDFSCNFPRHTMALEEILIKAGHLSREQFDRLCREHDCQSDHDLEKNLLQKKLISRETLEEINLRRLIESFIITLQWTRGHYKFIPTSEICGPTYFPPQDANFIILEALRQTDEMAEMKKRLQPLNRVFETTLTLALGGEELSDHDRSFFREGLEKQFSRDELEIYQLFDGHRSLEEILSHSTLGQFHTCRIILDFLNRGIITSQSEEPEEIQLPGRFSDSGFYQNCAAFVLLLASCSVALSILLSGIGYSLTGSRRAPSFLVAIIENLKADQENSRIQARNLLAANPRENSSQPQ
ncbi:MAG: DUF4388 domain-containing protein [Deltaproteobacteria bacterium]|nr:DUF4388 domain-containing protein [Deltaproteobacteria bacterium]